MMTKKSHMAPFYWQSHHKGHRSEHSILPGTTIHIHKRPRGGTRAHTGPQFTPEAPYDGGMSWHESGE